MDLTNHWVGLASLLIFALAYAAVVAEEYTHLRKSKPVMLAAGVIWALIAYQSMGLTDSGTVEAAIHHYLAEFSALFLFLLVAMTYVNSMTERNVFDVLKAQLVSRGYSYRGVFWVTGVLSFCLSPLIDNLTTALVMCAIVMAVGQDNPRFVALGSINIVVAANAGGAFSPFGDITTLMVWQKGVVEFGSFFALLLPSLVNYIVPACGLALAISSDSVDAIDDGVQLKRGAKRVIFLFGCTIVTAVSFHNFLHLPPFLGMMTGLAYLKFFGYYLKRTGPISNSSNKSLETAQQGDVAAFDSFEEISRVEWDTLLFFFGVIMCVGGLGFIGYLDALSATMYDGLGPTSANILVGILSAVIDNIPVMVAVLEMMPVMDQWQWLLVTLTAGVGGSLLSVGSAAGVALMGQTKGAYTFFSHLKWTPLIFLGYGLSILTHYFVNS